MNKQTLQIGSWGGNYVSILPSGISANKGLDYPRLIIPLTLETNPIKENTKKYDFAILNVQAGLFLEKQLAKISDSIPSAFAYNVIMEDSGMTYNLEFPIDHKRIIKIEEQRRNNLNLQLQIHFVIGVLEQSYPNKIVNSNVYYSFEIEQSHWVSKILPNLNYGEYFLIEIPKGIEYLEDAWQYIVKADDCFNTWDTKGAFANCREAVSILSKTLDNKLKNNPNAEKWKRNLDFFKHSISLYLHVEDVKGQINFGKIDIKKNDTEHIIILTKALVKYTDGLLKEQTENDLT